MRHSPRLVIIAFRKPILLPKVPFNPMQKHLLKTGLIAFVCLWIGIILFEYFFQNHWHLEAYNNFQYYGMLLTVLGIGVGMGALWHFKKSLLVSRLRINGLLIFTASLLIVLLVSKVHGDKISLIQVSGAGLVGLAGKYIGTVGFVYLILLVCYTLGDLILRVFPIPVFRLSQKVLKLGIGIMGLVCMLFLLGSMHILMAGLLIPLFIIIALLNLEGVKEFVLSTLWRPLKTDSRLNSVGVMSFWIVLFFASVNCVQIIRPIPIGYDALTLYVRLPSLILQYNGLVDGFQMYNWSLFMALGFILNKSIPFTLALSYAGGIMSMFALYALARRWMDVNNSLLVLLLFYTIPFVNFHSYQEMKIDLGLLFISLCILLLLSNWIRPEEKPEVDEMTTFPWKRSASKKSWEYVTVASVLQTSNAKQWKSLAFLKT